MVRQVFALFDEYQSKENAKHVLRAMQENARQGFWNGAAAPYGYCIVAAEQRGAKTKKRLAIDPVEAEVVRLMFHLAHEGDGTGGPMGVKALTSYLNERGHRTRKGARWGVGQLHKLLTSPTYKGDYRFNRKVWKTKEAKPETEQVAVPVKAIIDPARFDAVQSRLKARNPKVMPPRVVTGPILLTGLATCASCGGGMTLRTGKSGRYRYYTCAAAAQKGKSACQGRTVPMDRLDTAVTTHLADKLFAPDRVRHLLSGLLERQTARSEDHSLRLTALQNKVADSESRLSRLYQAIESGVVEFSDPTLKDRVAALKAERDQAKAALERAFAELTPQTRLTEEKISAFASLMRQNVTSGAVPFRRAWLRAVIDEVEVDDSEVRIHGRRDVMERLVTNGAAVAAVPSFVRKWRTGEDSNSRPPDS